MGGTCVVYLVWGPLGLEPLERFAASYRAHPAGLEHRLVLALKGVDGGRVADCCAVLGDDLVAECLELPSSGLDLDSYLLAARQLDDSSVCFLNSSSEILADGWVDALAQALEQPGVGLVGATGSYESALSSAPRPLRPFLRRRYPPFPNPHVRTNAFMIQRDVMLGLDWPSARRKRRALELESGNRSVTRQIRIRGLRALVVGRDGRTYEQERWPESLTFRCGSQENLLIADNRTRQYAQASPELQARLARFAWGERAPFSSSPRARAPAA